MESINKIEEKKKVGRPGMYIDRNEKRVCFCGGRFTLFNKSRHMKSKIHTNYFDKLDQYGIYEIKRFELNEMN